MLLNAFTHRPHQQTRQTYLKAFILKRLLSNMASVSRKCFILQLSSQTAASKNSTSTKVAGDQQYKVFCLKNIINHSLQCEKVKYMVHYVQNSHLLHTTEEEAGRPPGAGNGPKFEREEPAKTGSRYSPEHSNTGCSQTHF